MRLFKNYYKLSKSPIYSIFFILPLIIIYEILLFSFNHSDIIGMRNGADALLRQFFALFNIYGFYLVGFVVLIGLFISYYFQSKHENFDIFMSRFYLLMFLESMIYAIILFIFVEKIGDIFLMPTTIAGKRQLIALSMGAGIYEELIFRVVLIKAGIFLLKDIFRFSGWVSNIGTVLFASFIFAVFHYIGIYGDEFNIVSFSIRFSAGIFLSILFLLRGYGIAVYTHSIYDLVIVIF